MVVNGPEIYRLRVWVHRLTAAELGAKVGCTGEWIRDVENGATPSDVTVSKIAAALGVKVGDIIGARSDSGAEAEAAEVKAPAA